MKRSNGRSIGRWVGRWIGPSRFKKVRIYLIALWKLVRHPDAPRSAKWIAIAVIAYAVSPIDLIPDFIPVLGLLDDLIIVPLGVALVVSLTPKPLWNSLLLQAEASAEKLPSMKWGALIVALVWIAVVALIAWWLWGRPTG
jgi:uncharacterized membrane protein YkvA (DUF1232 family)